MSSNESPRLSREATAAAFQKHHLAKNDSRAWETMAELFADDAQYSDVFYGQMQGKEAIRKFLRESMKGLEDWTFPVQWTAIDEGRVVVHWLNRLPQRRPDGSHYEFPGFSIMTYDTAGKITSQMDFYDRLEALQVVTAAKSGALGRAIGQTYMFLAPIARQLLDVAHALAENKRQ